MHDAPLAGMFSFFPCVPAAEPAAGFARPEICLPGVVSPKLRQGLKIGPPVTMDGAAALWRSVVEQVRAQSLWRGVRGVANRRIMNDSLLPMGMKLLKEMAK